MIQSWPVLRGEMVPARTLAAEALTAVLHGNGSELDLRR